MKIHAFQLSSINSLFIPGRQRRRPGIQGGARKITRLIARALRVKLKFARLASSKLASHQTGQARVQGQAATAHQQARSPAAAGQHLHLRARRKPQSA